MAFQKLPDGTTVQERADTAKLNAEQLAKADAETARYQQSVSQYEQQKAAIAEQTAAAQAKYADETAAYEAEKARVAAMAAEERQKWEADVAACKAGDTSRCAKPQPKE
jgi:fused signal recognition particle receptor